MSDSNHRLTLRRTRRIVRQGDFARVRAGRCTASDGLLVVYVLPNGRDHPRVGLAVSRRHGNAVRRNRLRRLLREAFRLEQHNLPAGFDYVLIPRPSGTIDLSACRRSLLHLGHQAVRRWQQRADRQAQPPDPR